MEIYRARPNASTRAARSQRQRPAAPQPAQQRPRSGEAALLASRTLRLVRIGIRLRASGRCAAADGRERRHTMHGHDRGCAAIGISMRSLARAVQRWDRVGAAGLVLDAIGATVNEIVSARLPPSDLEAADEILTYEMGRRLSSAGEGGTDPE